MNGADGMDVEPGTNPSSFLYQQNTMRDAMLAGVTLNIFNNHCDRKNGQSGSTANVITVILTNKQKIILTPTYHVMEMYNVHQDAVMIPVSPSNLFYTEGNDSLPAISVSASNDKEDYPYITCKY